MKKQFASVILFSCMCLSVVCFAQPTATPGSQPNFQSPAEKEQWIKDHPDEYQKMMNNSAAVQNAPSGGPIAMNMQPIQPGAEGFYLYAEYTVIETFKADAKTNDKIKAPQTELTLSFGDLSVLKMPLPIAMTTKVEALVIGLEALTDEMTGLNYLQFSRLTMEQKDVMQFNDAIVTTYLMKCEMSVLQ